MTARPTPPGDRAEAPGSSDASEPAQASSRHNDDVPAQGPSRSEETGSDPQDQADVQLPPPVVDPGDLDVAAAAALARAREAARAKGLRPGSAPLRRRRRVTDASYSTSRTDGRDPLLLGEQLDKLLLDRGWSVDVSAGAVMGRWPVIVGADVAAHSSPVSFEDGVLVVRADSTAWATQLRHMSSSLLTRLEAETGAGVVVSLRIVGPSAPSWRKGPRRAAGPGPRDTYG